MEVEDSVADESFSEVSSLSEGLKQVRLTVFNSLPSEITDCLDYQASGAQHERAERVTDVEKEIKALKA